MARPAAERKEKPHERTEPARQHDEGIGFFEADGGIWKLEAKKNIADYFLKNMGDLIDAGKVVVMQ